MADMADMAVLSYRPPIAGASKGLYGNKRHTRQAPRDEEAQPRPAWAAEGAFSRPGEAVVTHTSRSAAYITAGGNTEARPRDTGRLRR